MFIDWHNLQNPVLAHKEWSLKDPCMSYHNGRFYIFYSAFHGGNYCRLSGTKTRDFKAFSEPLFLWGEGDKGWCSPNLTKIGDSFYLTYQSWDSPKGPETPKKQLFYAVSKDLENWDAHRPLARNLTRGIRSIDPAICKHNHKFYLIWKERQTPQIAVGSSLDSASWARLGRPFEPWAENGQFIRIEGKWHLVVKGKPDSTQYLIPMVGSGNHDEDWMNWGKWQVMEFPGGANACFIADWRKYDGYFYTIFCKKENPATEPNMGNTLGIARSKNLRAWVLPGMRER